MFTSVYETGFRSGGGPLILKKSLFNWNTVALQSMLVSAVQQS